MARESSDSAPMRRLASSCAWNVPSRREECPRRQPDRVRLGANGGHDAAHVRAAVCIGEHDDAARAVLPQDLVGPVRFAHVGDLPDRNPSRRALDQKIGEPAGGALRLLQAQHDIVAARPIDDARDDAAVREAFQLLGYLRRLQPIERRALVIDAHLELRECGSASRPAGRPARECPTGAGACPLRWCAGASRSSPNIFSAISARTPESIWSSRCEIGWPTLTDTGSIESRSRRSARISAFGRPPVADVDLDFRGVNALGMLVEFRASRAPARPPSPRELRAADAPR